MKNLITMRQKELLDHIYGYIEDSGFPPTLEDMRNALNISSNQAILDLLKALEKKNCIERDNTARGIRIKPRGYEELQKQPLVKVAGTSAAGPAIQAIEQNEWLKMPSGYEKLENVFVIKIAGNSMIEANIYDGDAVLIREERYYKSGDIVLARNSDGVTLKRFINDGNRTYLKPENPACRNIPITHDTIFLGKMIGQIER